MPSQGALPHSLESSRLRPPGTESRVSRDPARAAFNGRNLTASLGIYTLSLHTRPLEVDCVPTAYTVTTSRGRSGQPLNVSSVPSPEAHSPGFLPGRETDRITVRRAGPWGSDSLSSHSFMIPSHRQYLACFFTCEIGLTPTLPPRCS